MNDKLTEKYQPRSLADLCGQPWIVHQLGLWLELPCPTAFLFSGGTGTGKTSAALVLARELGIAVEEQEFGGFHQISSGEQTGESVRKAMAGLRVRPFLGSGWKMLVVNEAEAMTPGAANVWLDALENLPPQTVIVFTTNKPSKLTARFRDRCEHFEFASGFLALRPALQNLARRVWWEETGAAHCRQVEDFGALGDENGDASFRRLLQLMEAHVRQARFQMATAG